MKLAALDPTNRKRVSDLPLRDALRIGRDSRPPTSGTDEHDEVAQRLAKEYGVSVAQILENARFAEAVDYLADVLGLEVRTRVLAGRLNKKRVFALRDGLDA
jgi:hypothetical protein